MEHLTSFYDSTLGERYFNSNDAQSAISTEELHLILQKLASSLDLSKLCDTFFAVIQQRLHITGIRVDNKLGQLSYGDTEEFSQSKQFELQCDNNVFAKISYFFRRALSFQDWQALKAMHHCLRFPLKNAITFAEAQQLAMRDHLTGLGNRAMYDDTLAKECHHAQRSGNYLSLVAIDLDKFKQVNDCFGHSEGDRVLMAVANAISQALRGSDYAFRFGGDEFCCVLKGADRHTSQQIVQRICSHINEQRILQRHHVTCSFGIATLDAKDSESSLFKRADTALYEAKRAGRNQTAVA